MSKRFEDLRNLYCLIIDAMQKYLLQENNNVNEVKCLDGTIKEINLNCNINDLSAIDAAIEYNKKSGE